MPAGFFAGSDLTSRKPPSLVARCGECGLYKTCRTPKMEPTGKGERKVLVCAEAPGADEDAKGVQLIGEAGQTLRKVLRQIDVSLDDDCIKTNALTCRPPKNRTPTDKEVEYCRPNLLQTIEQHKPEVIILMGGSACQSLLSHVWKEGVGEGVGRWVGWQIPSQVLNTWICPTWHPSYIAREKRNEALHVWWARHLEAAFKLPGRPWDPVPDYEARVQLVYDAEDACRFIRQAAQCDGMAAFDYETNMLKPDNPDAAIVSASIAWGKRSVEQCVAFPFTNQTRAALGEFLRSPVPKIASNIKFEDRWTRKFYGHRVRNWSWCTMNAAHVIDHRPGITGLKFQAFVNLGFPWYAESVGEFLETDGTMTVNRILSEVSLPKLLLYNSLDSYLEFEVAVKQMKQLKSPPPWRASC